MPSPMTHEARLDLLGQVAVNVGLGLRPGQELVLTAPLDAVCPWFAASPNTPTKPAQAW